MAGLVSSLFLPSFTSPRPCSLSLHALGPRLPASVFRLRSLSCSRVHPPDALHHGFLAVIPCSPLYTMTTVLPALSSCPFRTHCARSIQPWHSFPQSLGSGEISSAGHPGVRGRVVAGGEGVFFFDPQSVLSAAASLLQTSVARLYTPLAIRLEVLLTRSVQPWLSAPLSRRPSEILQLGPHGR